MMPNVTCIYVDSNNLNDYNHFVADHFRWRKYWFIDRFRWDLQPRGDMEIDEYDHDEAGYIFVLFDGVPVASQRALPTLSDTLPIDQASFVFGKGRHHISDPSVQPSKDIWELGRTVTDPEIIDQSTLALCHAALAVASIETCRAYRISSFICIVRQTILPLFDAPGWTYHPIGIPVRDETDTPNIALQIMTDDGSLAQVRKFFLPQYKIELPEIA